MQYTGRERQGLFHTGARDFPTEPVGEPGGFPEFGGGKRKWAEAVPVIERKEPGCIPGESRLLPGGAKKHLLQSDPRRAPVPAGGQTAQQAGVWPWGACLSLALPGERLPL